MNLEVTSIQLVAFPSCVNPSVNNRKLLSYFPAMYILFCCSTLLLLYPILYCPHFFHLLLSHSISNRIANMQCAMHSMAKYFLQNWLTQSLRWCVLTQVETVITYGWLFANLSSFCESHFFHLNILYSGPLWVQPYLSGQWIFVRGVAKGFFRISFQWLVLLQ